ncbi:MAG: hypothetical protein ACP5PZ_12235, partial [Bacteroidales bacterium]
LSPDNNVQAPTNSQNLNRYSYCLNNPLKYTDPSGKIVWFIPVIIGAIVGGYIGGAAANGWEANPVDWKWNGDTWSAIGPGMIIGAAIGLIGGNLEAFIEQNKPRSPNQPDNRDVAVGEGALDKRDDSYSGGFGAFGPKVNGNPGGLNQGYEITDPQKYPGVRIYVVSTLQRGFFDPFSRTIFLPSRYSTGYIQHEYGHYLQLKSYGLIGFIFVPMLSSATSAAMENLLENALRKKIWNHDTFYWERDANRRAAEFFTKPTDYWEYFNSIFNDNYWPK